MKYCMFKILVVYLFVFLFGLISYDVVANLFEIDFTFYLLSLLVLVFSMIIYPFNFELKYSTDLIFLTVFAVVFLNIINLFFVNTFSFRSSFFNICIGVFGVLLGIVRNSFKLS